MCDQVMDNDDGGDCDVVLHGAFADFHCIHHSRRSCQSQREGEGVVDMIAPGCDSTDSGSGIGAGSCCTPDARTGDA